MPGCRLLRIFHCTRPVRPLPGTASNSATSCGFLPLFLCHKPRLLLPADVRSSAPVQTLPACQLLSRDTPSAGSTSVTLGSPLVIVPVLSSATISVFPVSSSDTAVLNMMPFFAPIPFPTMIATGVASPSAHGQLMTSTEIPRASANPMLCPASSHTDDRHNRNGDNRRNKDAGYLVRDLGNRCFGRRRITDHLNNLRKCCILSDSALLHSVRKPDWFKVAAETVSPFALSTGMLSPVSADSFTALFPSSTIPSTGIFSPGRTTK